MSRCLQDASKFEAGRTPRRPSGRVRTGVEDFHAVSGAGTTEDGDCDLFSTAMRLHVATTAKKKCANATADALTAAVVKNRVKIKGPVARAQFSHR